MEGLSFSFIETWTTDFVAKLTSSSITILTATLGLLALIVGTFFLLGLGKKAVKKAK